MSETVLEGEKRATNRNTVHCPTCGLLQFETVSGKCRRCSNPLHGNPLPPAPPPAAPRKGPGRYTGEGLALTLRTLRNVLGLSQRGLAEICGCPRTYISKIETANSLPTLSSFERFARAFGLTSCELARFWEFMENGK